MYINYVCLCNRSQPNTESLADMLRELIYNHGGFEVIPSLCKNDIIEYIIMIISSMSIINLSKTCIFHSLSNVFKL